MLTPFFYSPFSHSKVAKEKNCALLLQFILTEIFFSLRENANNASWDTFASEMPILYPYDCKQETGSLNRMKEHIALLGSAFPRSPSDVNAVQDNFDGHYKNLASCKDRKKNLAFMLQELTLLLTPFILECKENPGLIYFLLAHKKSLMEATSQEHVHLLFQSLCPKGTNALRETLYQYFEQKGLAPFILKTASLVDELENIHA